jgi:anaerobic selenocysteine-containing dehydrogenase
MMANSSPAVKPVLDAFMDAIGAVMRFTPVTVDKPGKRTARALHGWWMAPWQGFDAPDVILILGMNPLVSHQGFPIGNPGQWIKQARERGMQLIVIDPRRSETADRASLFLQPRPGHDIAILAALLNVILAEKLHDEAFTAEHVQGLDALRAAVAPYTPDAVGAASGVDPQDLVRAARLFGGRRRGFVIAGTGPHMAGQGTLVEYLVLALDALCGHYLRAGEFVRNPGTLAAQFSAKAQAHPPEASLTGRTMPGSGLPVSVAGPPIPAAPDAMLTQEEGGIRCLISVGANPVAAWPDQLKTIEGLRSLDLLVQMDPWMSQTAKLAHYVIAPKLPLEVAVFTQGLEAQAAYAPGYGCADAYAQYAPAAVEPPEGAEVIEEWEFLHRLALRMGLPLRVAMQVWGKKLEPFELGDETPTTEALLDVLAKGSRVPLSEVKGHPHGGFFPDPPVRVAPAEAGWTGRLEVGDRGMMADLASCADDLKSAGHDDEFRLICRRLRHVYNSTGNIAEAHRGRPYNPAFMHPDDLQRLGLSPGDLVELSSSSGKLQAVAQPDAQLRTGLVSIAHAFGDLPDEEDPQRSGANVNRLLTVAAGLERITSQAPMSNIAVRVRPIA